MSETILEARLDSLEDVWKHLKNALRPRPNMLPDYFPFRKVHVWHWNDEWVFDFPYNPILRNNLIERLERCGWRVTSRKLLKGDDQITLEHPNQNTPIRLDFDANVKGSVCEKKLIGWETVTREEPIYEVTCPEGAEEDVFA